MRSFVKILNILLTCALTAIVVLQGSELIQYVMTSSSEYPFGTERGWRYRSSFHYVGSLVALVVAAMGGVVLGAFVRSATERVIVRGGIALMIIGEAFYGYAALHGT